MIEKCGQYDMLTFYLWYNPRQHEAIMEQIRQYQTHPCFIGVKIHPREDGVSLDTGIYDRLVAYAEEKGILILCHTWDTEPQNRPASFFRVLQNNPKLKLLIGHMGGTYDGCMDSLRLAREYENVYCDINGSLYSQIWIEELVKMAPEHKFIFSTDQTFNDPRSMLGRVLLSQLPDDLKRSILCENIDQSANQYQQVGWIGMENVSGTIVLTFHFNGNFSAGQTYILGGGSVFGFTDGSSFTLADTYTFTYDGSTWSMAAGEPEQPEQTEPEQTEPEITEPEETGLTFQYRYGAAKLIQVNTNLPASIPVANFLATDNGCSIDQSANRYQQVGWIAMENVGGTIVLTFNFNSAFTAGQDYFLPAGAVFGFTDGSKYTLEQNYTFTFDGTSWTMEATKGEEPEVTEPEITEPETTEPEITEPETTEPQISLEYRYGTNNLIQMNTNLPASTPCVNFLATDNGCNIDQSANLYQQVGWIGMENVGGTIVLTFHFNGSFAAGQAYLLPAGAVFGFTDGNKYELDGDYTFAFDGTAWTMTVVKPEENTLSFQYRYGSNKLIQVNTDLPLTTPIQNFLTTDNGSCIDESKNQYQNVGWIAMENVNGVIVLTFNFNSPFTAGQTYCLPIGAIFGFADGSQYTLDRDYLFTFNGSGWSMSES